MSFSPLYPNPQEEEKLSKSVPAGTLWPGLSEFIATDTGITHCPAVSPKLCNTLYYRLIIVPIPSKRAEPLWSTTTNHDPTTDNKDHLSTIKQLSNIRAATRNFEPEPGILARHRYRLTRFLSFRVVHLAYFVAVVAFGVTFFFTKAHFPRPPARLLGCNRRRRNSLPRGSSWS